MIETLEPTPHHGALASDALDPLSPDARRAWQASLLAQLPQRAQRVLCAEAREHRHESGEIMRRGLPPGVAPVDLIVVGLARTHIRAPSGREATVRYAAEGELVGLPVLFAGHRNPGTTVEVVVSTTVLSLPAHRFVQLVASDATVALTLARYLAEMMYIAERLWVSNVFQDMSARVAFHLLELSTRDADGLVVHATQDELARAVGSVREVVARSLKGLADDRLIRRGTGTIRLLDPAGLHRVASADAPA